MSPRKKTHLKSRRRALTLEEECALSFGGIEERFASPTEARALYFQNYEQMQKHADDAQRPLAWWIFEQGEGRPSGSPAEIARLAALGELTDAERAELRVRGVEIQPDPGKRAIAETPADRLWWRRP
jgi:hypothetical protein